MLGCQERPLKASKLNPNSLISPETHTKTQRRKEPSQAHTVSWQEDQAWDACLPRLCIPDSGDQASVQSKQQVGGTWLATGVLALWVTEL